MDHSVLSDSIETAAADCNAPIYLVGITLQCPRKKSVLLRCGLLSDYYLTTLLQYLLARVIDGLQLQLTLPLKRTGFEHDKIP